MTTFKEIRGKLIRTLDSDLPATPAYVGEIWYNKTIGVLKTVQINTDAWSSGGTLSTPRYDASAAGQSTQTAGLVFAGYEAPPGAIYGDKTEEYDGTTWTAGGNLSTGGYRKGDAGTQTAGLGFTGYAGGATTATEEYNGSSWTSGGAYPQALRDAHGLGTQTAALGLAGVDPSPAFISAVNEYNGSSWSAGTAMPGVRAYMGTSGIQTAGLSVGGRTGPTNNGTTDVFEYDGSTWTVGGSYLVSIARNAAAGTQTASLGFSGYQPSPPTPVATYKYDGTSWTASVATLGSGRYAGVGLGTQSAAVAAAGGPPSNLTSSENFNEGTPAIVEFTTS